MIPSDIIHVSAAIILEEKKILIARRAHVEHHCGLWEFPGGKIEIGESAEQCLIREIKEELGIDISVDDLYMENIFDDGSKIVSLKAFICSRKSGPITLIAHDRICWVQKSEFKNYQFAPADVALVEKLISSNLL